VQICLVAVSVCLPGEPPDFVIKAFLTGIGEAFVFPECQESFDSFAGSVNILNV